MEHICIHCQKPSSEDDGPVMMRVTGLAHYGCSLARRIEASAIRDEALREEGRRQHLEEVKAHLRRKADRHQQTAHRTQGQTRGYHLGVVDVLLNTVQELSESQHRNKAVPERTANRCGYREHGEGCDCDGGGGGR
jgi:hypothetical protein